MQSYDYSDDEWDFIPEELNEADEWNFTPEKPNKFNPQSKAEHKEWLKERKEQGQKRFGRKNGSMSKKDTVIINK